MLEISFSEAAQAHFAFYVSRTVAEGGLNVYGDQRQLSHALQRTEKRPEIFQAPTLETHAARVLGDPNKFLCVEIGGKKGRHAFEFPGDQPELIVKLLENVEKGVIKPQTISVGRYN